MSNVVIYTTSYCPYCTRAKALLTQKKVHFTEISIEHDQSKRNEMTEKSNRHKVPQIFINDQAIGGCDDLYALDKTGQLDKLLKG